MKSLLRHFRCLLYIFLHGLKHVRCTVYISKGCGISKDLRADDHVYIGPGCRIGPGVTIGAYSMIGPGVNFTGDDHLFDKVGTPIIFSGRPVLRKTTIGRDVWIGTNAIIMAGSTISDGAIIAAGAVVNSDVHECEIHGGIPNRKIKDRFLTEQDKRTHLDMLGMPIIKGTFCETKQVSDD